MKIQNASFVKTVSINDSKVYFDARSEVVFVGRSNVWKSSLMYALMHKKDLVKTSSKPGKTRNANIFFVNEKYYFTDLPGYGFAKLGQALREDLDALISWYLEERKQYIKKVVLVVDAKIGPQEKDIEMMNFLNEMELSPLIVLSKCDRLWKNDINKSLAHTQKVFFGQQIESISSLKWEGIDDVRKILGDALKS